MLIRTVESFCQICPRARKIARKCTLFSHICPTRAFLPESGTFPNYCAQNQRKWDRGPDHTIGTSSRQHTVRTVVTIFVSVLPRAPLPTILLTNTFRAYLREAINRINYIISHSLNRISFIIAHSLPIKYQMWPYKVFYTRYSTYIADYSILSND